MAAEVEFQDAEDLRAELTRLISENKIKFGHIQSSIFCLRRRVSESPAKWYARVSLVPNRYKDKFGGAIYVLEVDSQNFDCLEKEQKEAILFHELCHTWMSEKGSYKLVQHDIQEFLAVVDKFGGYLPDTVRLMNIAKKHLAEEKKAEQAKMETTSSL